MDKDILTIIITSMISKKGLYILFIPYLGSNTSIHRVLSYITSESMCKSMTLVYFSFHSLKDSNLQAVNYSVNAGLYHSLQVLSI